MTGNIQETVRLERRSETDIPDTDTLQIRQGYNLTAAGPIYDARLASFTLTGAFSLDDTWIDPGPDQNLRVWSVFSSLSLLSATRFPLGLRFSRTEGEGKDTSTTGTSYGATWNANFRKLPALQLSYDRSETESEQSLGTRTLTVDSARVRLSKRLTRSSYELEYERRDTEDNQGFSETGDHARFSSYHRFGDAWNVSTSALVDREDRDGILGGSDSRNLALSSSVSYLPDPDLSASGAAHFSRTDAGDTFSQTLGGSVRATKRFHILPELEGSAFGSGSLSQTESSFLAGETFWSSGLGGDMISTQLKPIRVGVGYGLGVSKGAAAAVAPIGGVAVGPPEAGGLQAVHRVNLNVASRTLTPYTLSGDYTFVLEQGALDRQTHTTTVQATGSPFAGLSFRALLQGSLANNPEVRVASADLSATYSPRFNLSLTSGASASIVEAGDQSTFITRIPLILRYQPWRHTTIFLEGFREDITNSLGPDRVSHEARLRVERPFRLIRLSLEFRFRDTESGDSRTQDAQIMFTISRSFAYNF